MICNKYKDAWYYFFNFLIISSAGSLLVSIKIFTVRKTPITRWPPSRVTALQVVRTSFLGPRPRLSPPPPAPSPPPVNMTHALCMRVHRYGVKLSATEAFYLSCLHSLRAFAGCFFWAEWRILETTFHKRVLYGIEVFLRWKWVYCSLAVTPERTVFPFVKQYIEDKMAAECCLIRDFAHIFWAARKGQYDNFPLNNRAIDI